MKLKLIVIKTDKIEQLKNQYEGLGLKFDYHNHGNGPFHYATEINDIIFEIYPLPKSKTEPDNTTRLGFEILDLESKIQQLENEGWIIQSQPKQTQWGLMAIVQDLDGRKIELTSTNNG